MDKQSFSEQLKNKLEKIEVSNTISSTKEFTKEEFEREAKGVKSTFKDEHPLQQPTYH